MRLRLPSWSATAPAGRGLLVVAAVLGVVAAGAGSVAVRTPPTRLTRIIAADVPATPALDAAGCPPGARCLVRDRLPDHVRQAIQRGFPAGRLLWQSSTVDAGTGQLYQAQAAASLGPGASLVLTTQCVPGSAVQGADVATSSARQRSDLAGNQIALATLRFQRVAGAPGCQLEVVLTALGDGSGYLAGLVRLSHDPAAQVRGP